MSIEQPIPASNNSSSWPAFGVFDLLVVDNGLDLTSSGTREACAALGIDILFTPPRSPWYKGTVERFGRTMNTRFVHWLPGTTLGKATSDLGYNGADEATLTFSDFESLLVQYITTIHNKTPRRKHALSPERLFVTGCQKWPVRVPTSMMEFDAAVALSRTAKLQQHGITFLGLQYQCEALGNLWNRSPTSTRLLFKVNPLNLQRIQVRHPAGGEYFAVGCVDDFAWPRTLSMHLAARAHAKAIGLNPMELRDLVKAEADLMKKHSEAATKSGRILRRMQAELLRQSQADLTEEESGSERHSVTADTTLDAFDAVFSDE